MSDLHIVIGPPCSGKSTYVDEHAKSGEVRIDFDRIAVALGSETPHDPPRNIKSAAFGARQGAIDRVIEDGIPAWVIHSNPSDEQMSAYEKAGAEFVWMDADLETCLKRAEDDDRPSVTFAVIREWFEQHKDQQRSAPQGAFSLAKEVAMPFKPNERQYRSFAASNFTVDEQSTDEVQSWKVRGYWTTFEDPYELMPGWFETIDSHALDETDMSDVIMQYDHSGPVLARQRNGSLVVSVDEHGGFCEADLGGCQQARDLYESIKNGLVTEMSFGFTIADDGFEWTEDEDGTIHTRVTKISRVYDVSGVSIPANSSTSIASARSYVDAAIEAKRMAEKAAQEAAEMEQREQRAAEEAARAAIRKRRALAFELETA